MLKPLLVIRRYNADPLCVVKLDLCYRRLVRTIYLQLLPHPTPHVQIYSTIATPSMTFCQTAMPLLDLSALRIGALPPLRSLVGSEVGGELEGLFYLFVEFVLGSSGLPDSKGGSHISFKSIKNMMKP